MPEKKGISIIRIVKTVMLSILVLGTMAIGIMYFVTQDTHFWAVRNIAYFLIALLIAVGLAYVIGLLYAIAKKTTAGAPRTSLIFDFFIWVVMFVGAYAVLFHAVQSAAFRDADWFKGLSIAFPYPRILFGFSLGPVVIVTCFFIHAFFLIIARRLDTHSARVKALLLLLLLFLIGAVASAWFGGGVWNQYSMQFRSEANRIELGSRVMWAGLLLLFWLPGFIVYSLPSSWLSLLPLALHYFALAFYLFNAHGDSYGPAILTFAYMPLAGYLFPKYRRIKEYWKPSRLPRIAARRAGYTLIELLIMIALLAILTAGLATLSSTVSRTHSRQNRWERGLQMAQDEFALLRGQPQLPALGVHPIEPQLQKNYEFAGASQVEIKPGPSDGLREVRITVRMRGEGLDKDIELAALLPAGRNSR